VSVEVFKWRIEAKGIFGRNGCACWQWVAGGFVSMFRKRFGVIPLSFRFRFDFVSLRKVDLEGVVRPFRFRFDFVSVLIRFRFAGFSTKARRPRRREDSRRRLSRVARTGVLWSDVLFSWLVDMAGPFGCWLKGTSRDAARREPVFECGEVEGLFGILSRPANCTQFSGHSGWLSESATGR
jgi:hypothetical protein